MPHALLRVLKKGTDRSVHGVALNTIVIVWIGDRAVSPLFSTLRS